ncbi:MAG: ATP-binding protein [Methanolinea sp.]|nr:ATP-binding protein [Methanolinea sp.]
MRVRHGIIFIIISVTLVSGLVVVAGMQAVMFPAIEAIEKREAGDAVARVLKIIESDLLKLKGTCDDWGKWDDTYFFLQGENPGYVASNLLNETFEALQVDLILFYTPEGELFFGKGYDHTGGVPLSVPEELGRIPLEPGKVEPGNESRGEEMETVSGILTLPNTSLLVSIGPVLRSDRSGPTAGYFAVGRYLDDEEVARLAALSSTNPQFAIIREGRGEGSPSRVQPSPGESPVGIRVSDDTNSLIAETVIRDIHGYPALLLGVTMERATFRIARDSMVFFLILVGTIGGTFVILGLLFIDRRFLRRLSHLEEKVSEITRERDFGKKTAIQGDDEIASLSRSIDTMLAALSEHIAKETAEREKARLANAKLTLLSRITRHDVLNQVSVIRGFSDLLGESIPESSEEGRFIERIKTAAKTIERQLAFTRMYELEGEDTSLEWINVHDLFLEVARGMGLFGVKAEVAFDDLFILSDRLLGKIFYTLIDNSLAHGEKVSRVSLSFYEEDGSCVLVYEDDGVGVPPEQKELIFEQGVGNHLGLGLFLARGILSVFGITIRETGEYGRGARFEMRIPSHAYRKGSPGKTPPGSP